MGLTNHWLETFGVFILHYLQLKFITDINISKNIYDFIGLSAVILYSLGFSIFISSMIVGFVIKIKKSSFKKNATQALANLSLYALLICLLLMIMPTIFINIEAIRYFRKINRYSKRWKKYQKAYKFWKNSHIHTIHDLHTPFNSCLEFGLLVGILKLILLNKLVKIDFTFKRNKNALVFNHDFYQIRKRSNLEKTFVLKEIQK